MPAANPRRTAKSRRSSRPRAAPRGLSQRELRDCAKVASDFAQSLGTPDCLRHGGRDPYLGRMTVTLEDHLGDILRKARRAANVSTAAAAQAAGLSETEWNQLEESGQGIRAPHLAAVAP